MIFNIVVKMSMTKAREETSLTDKLVRLGIVSVMGVLLLVTCTPPGFNGDEADNKAQAVVPHAGNDGEPQSQEPAQPETPRQKVGLAIFAVPEPTSPGSQTDDGDVSSVIAPPDWALGRWAGIIVGRVDPTALYLVFTKHDMTFNLVTNDKVSIAKLQQRGGISISNVNAADGSYEFTVTYTSNSNAETFKFTKTDSDTADFAIHSKSDSHTWSMIKQSDSVGEQWIFDVPEVQTPAPPTDATSRAVIAPPDWAIGEWIGVVINSVDATAMTLVVSANDMSIDLIGKDRVLLAELERDGAISISDTTTTDDRYQFTVTYSHNDASETLAFRRIRSDSADFTVHSQAGSDTWSMVKL